MSSVQFHVDTSAVFAGLESLRSAFQEVVRPAAQAGAQVFYDEVKVRAAAIPALTGNLNRSIYQAYSQDNSRPGVATYHVSWNASKAPHGHLIERGHVRWFKIYRAKNGKIYTMARPKSQRKGVPKPKPRDSILVKSRYYVLLPQPKFVPAKPFIRPAYESKKQAAVAAVQARVLAELREIFS